MILVDVGALLAFFDEEATGSTGHASAIVAFAGEDLGAALVAHYFGSQGIRTEILPDKCTQGTKKGCRLDRWILADATQGPTLYQVEIKNWSAHAIGGRRLARAASSSEVRQYKIDCWGREWTGTTFRKESMRKVLTPMRSPRSGIPIEPLTCFWTALHPDGADAPLFSMPLENNGHFRRVSIFSMSSYLRGIGEATISLPMPNLAARRRWLARLFPQSADAAAV